MNNRRVHDLARRAAALTGETPVSAVTMALERLIEDVEAQNDVDRKRQRADRVLGDIDRRLTDADRRAMTTDDLYNDSGLPR